MSKEKKNEPLRFGKHGDAAVSAPRYVRKIGKGYEYGEIEVNWDDRTKDKNRPLGKAPTLDEALAINQMAAMTEQTPTYRVDSPTGSAVCTPFPGKLTRPSGLPNSLL